MRWSLWRFLRWKPGASKKGRERAERIEARGQPGPKQATPEEMIEALNYEPEGDQEQTGELAREAWGATATITVALLGVLVAGLIVYVGGEAKAAYETRRAEPLRQAAAVGDLGRVEELLGSQVEPDAAGPDRETPLSAAIQGGHDEVVEALLAAGAEPSEDAVNTALRYGRREMLITLLEAGADPDTRNAWSTRSLLEMAADSGDAEMVQLLLKHGAAPTEAPGATFMTAPALHIALRQKRTEIALTLLRHGADPFIRSQGWTAAELAAETGQDEVVSAIREIQERRGDQHEAG
jgi:hypothetical protein